MSALPGVGGEQSAHASEINNQGMIAGESRVPGGYSHAVVWTANSASYVAHDLGTLGGNDGSGAYSISEPDIHGNVWVVGVSGSRGVLWQVDSQGSVLSITDLAPSSTAAWANDVKVIGNSVLVAGSSSGQAVIWETDLSGTVVHSTELATTAYEAIEADALNNDGDIAGWGREPGSLRNGFLYDNGGGVITDLGSLGNAGSKALGINDNDVVVGQYTNVKPYPLGQIEDHAFVWESGTMHKLFDQVTDHKFWLLWNALDVNNNGEIVGNGTAGREITRRSTVSWHGQKVPVARQPCTWAIWRRRASPMVGASGMPRSPSRSMPAPRYLSRGRPLRVRGVPEHPAPHPVSQVPQVTATSRKTKSATAA